MSNFTEQTGLNQTARDQAVAWALRLRDGSVADWEEFTLWLEADPRHVEAYDAVCEIEPLIDAGLTGLVACPLPAANENEPCGPLLEPGRPARRWAFWGVGLAAALATVLMVGPHWFVGQRYDIVTRSGEQRLIPLADGTQIALNGATRLTLDHGDPRFALLESGEARLEVVHNEAHPFTLWLGSTAVRDVGTIFDVVRDAAMVRVAVREGRVEYQSGTRNIPLERGQSLVDPAGPGPVRIDQRQADSIGGWREGRLSYAEDALAFVASDIARNTGEAVTVDPAIAGRRVTGTIMIEQDHSRFFARLAAMLDIRILHEGSGWRMVASARESR